MLNIEAPAGRSVSITIDEDLRCFAKAWRLRMPSGDWLDYTVFTGSSLVGTVNLPFGEYELEADFGEKGAMRKTIRVVEGQASHEIVLSSSAS